jgi:ethanolamine transporter EutH
MSRETLGTVVIGGMIGATFVDTFIVPVTFSVVERVAARYTRKGREHDKPKPPEPNG